MCALVGFTPFSRTAITAQLQSRAVTKPKPRLRQSLVSLLFILLYFIMKYIPVKLRSVLKVVVLTYGRVLWLLLVDTRFLSKVF